jgi:LAS superfamily LD-carboxypeptidase LdcB
MLKFMFPAILLSGLVIPIADGVPTLKYEQSCREAARADPLQQITAENCMKQEREAQEELGRDWDTFSAADRGHCQRLTTTGGMPSYVEFVTCLQISRDARQLRQQRPATEAMGDIPDISRER